MRDEKNIRTQNATQFKDRRRKADWVTNMATILSLLSWIIAYVVWMVLDKASPEKEHFFTRMFGTQVRNYWDTSLLPIAFALLVASLCICVAAFIFNMLRKRRKSDKYKKSIIVAGIITVCGIVLFVIRFGETLFS